MYANSEDFQVLAITTMVSSFVAEWYRKAQQDMRELVAVKGSVDHLRGLTDNQRNKEQAR